MTLCHYVVMSLCCKCEPGLRYQDKEHIRKSAYLLKGTKIGIADQFPKEIADYREL